MHRLSNWFLNRVTTISLWFENAKALSVPVAWIRPGGTLTDNCDAFSWRCATHAKLWAPLHVSRSQCLGTVIIIECHLLSTHREASTQKLCATSHRGQQRYLLRPCPSIGPKWFWTIQIDLNGYKLFWSDSNHFGQVKIRLLWTNLYNLDPTNTNWTYG